MYFAFFFLQKQTKNAKSEHTKWYLFLKYNSSLTFIFVPVIKALEGYINNFENEQK